MKQSERSEVTQTRLVAVAHDLFGAKGYAATSIDELVAAAGVTKGAFYHHFADKEAIFRRVFEDGERDIMAAVAAVCAEARDSAERMRTGYRAFLQMCLDPALRRIGLEDGPKVLGWATWRAIQWSYSLAFIEWVLEEAMVEGHLARRPKQALAHIFFGAVCEGASYIARAANPEVALREISHEMDEIVAALLERPHTDSSR